MIELSIHVRMDGGLTVRNGSKVADAMSVFSSRVLLRSKEITVNAKSLLGLISLGIREGMNVTVIAEGPDEAQAAVEMSRLLGS